MTTPAIRAALAQIHAAQAHTSACLASERADLLASFAAHAPSEIPKWFNPEPPPEPEEPIDTQEPTDLSCVSESVQEHIENWQYYRSEPDGHAENILTDVITDPEDPDYNADFAPDVIEFLLEYERKHAAYLDATREFNEKMERYPDDCEKAKYFQWRWFYAEQMLAHKPN